MGYEEAKGIIDLGGQLPEDIIRRARGGEMEDDVRPLPEPGDYPVVKVKVNDGAIKFKAHVWKVGSLGGGGLRVVLNLDKDYIRQMAMLAECQHDPEMELEFEARQSKD